ncbi:helix-turn-helix domain-containing protein [uncultured Methanofollis sp.]|nr:helix-turn-helix domain-containing protein [uncultured Methanofollis sp.]
MEQNITTQILAHLLRGDAHPRRKLAKDLGISHTTILRKLKSLLDG